MSRVGRHEEFIKGMLQECKQTRLYQLAEEKNLDELKKINSAKLFGAMSRCINYQKKGGNLCGYIFRSLIYAFAYEGKEDIVSFLLDNSLGKIKDVISGYAEAGNYDKVELLLKSDHSITNIDTAMCGYAVSGRIPQLADLIMLEGSDVFDNAICDFKSSELQDEKFQKVEILRLLMFIKDENLSLKIIAKLQKHLYFNLKYYDENDLSYMLLKAKEVREKLWALFNALSNGILVKEVIWLIAGYTTCIEPGECPSFFNGMTMPRTSAVTPQPHSSLLSWFKEYFSSGAHDQKPQQSAGCIVC